MVHRLTKCVTGAQVPESDEHKGSHDANDADYCLKIHILIKERHLSGPYMQAHSAKDHFINIKG